jgi:hypothetical protein
LPRGVLNCSPRTNRAMARAPVNSLSVSYQRPSWNRTIAGLSGFLTLIQSRDGPDRYGVVTPRHGAPGGSSILRVRSHTCRHRALPSLSTAAITCRTSKGSMPWISVGCTDRSVHDHGVRTGSERSRLRSRCVSGRLRRAPWCRGRTASYRRASEGGSHPPLMGRWNWLNAPPSARRYAAARSVLVGFRGRLALGGAAPQGNESRLTRLWLRRAEDFQ